MKTKTRQFVAAIILWGPLALEAAPGVPSEGVSSPGVAAEAADAHGRTRSAADPPDARGRARSATDPPDARGRTKPAADPADARSRTRPAADPADARSRTRPAADPNAAHGRTKPAAPGARPDARGHTSAETTKAGSAADQKSAHAGIEKGHGTPAPDSGHGGAAHSGTAAAQRGDGPAARSNTDRLRSLLGAQQRARPVRQPNQRQVGSTRVDTNRGSPAGPSMPSPAVAASRPALRASVSQMPLAGRSTVGGGTIGGGHSGGAAMLGGPATRGAARTTNIGAPFHPKF
jgi:hypothetical protein